MQILFLPKDIRQRVRVDEHTLTERAQERLAALRSVWALAGAGCPLDAAIASQNLSRRTFFRWQAAFHKGGPRALEPKSTAPGRRRGPSWGRREVNAVVAMRKRFPFMGHRPLRVMLAREGVHLTKASCDRIVRDCLRRRLFHPVAWLRGRVRPKRRRDFSTGHAQRWRFGMKASQPGQLVQVDHMAVSRDGQALKEFRAVDPVSRLMAARVFSRATAGNARRFLDAMLADLPFRVESIQVDGGSEFMADFEDACQAEGIDLWVLPPNRPQWNGIVERCNDTLRLEFWALWTGGLTVAEVAPALAAHQRWHNAERPHMALDWLAPIEHLASLNNMQLAA